MVNTELLGRSRLLLAELRQLDVHCGHRSSLCKHGKVNLNAGLFVEMVNQIVAIIHPRSIRNVG